MSNIDKERERIIRLKNYVNQISISSQPLKYDLINEIENCKITNTNEIKNHIEEFENKAKKKSDLIKIVNENHHLHCKLYNNIDFIYNLVDNTLVDYIITNNGACIIDMNTNKPIYEEYFNNNEKEFRKEDGTINNKKYWDYKIEEMTKEVEELFTKMINIPVPVHPPKRENIKLEDLFNFFDW